MQENKTLIFINVRLFILEISDVLTIKQEKVAKIIVKSLRTIKTRMIKMLEKTKKEMGNLIINIFNNKKPFI